MWEPIWMFERADQCLTLQQRETTRGVTLMVAGDGAPRSFAFRDLAALEKFRGDMERSLIKTGWILYDFAPERRSGADRRTLPRVTPDRRRWWPDSRGDALAPGMGEKRQA